MQIMSDSQFQYTSHQNQFQNNYDGRTSSVDINKPYFYRISKHKYSEDDIIKMIEFLVDNIFVVFAGKVFQQIVGIPMGTNCAPLLTDIYPAKKETHHSDIYN